MGFYADFTKRLLYFKCVICATNVLPCLSLKVVLSPNADRVAIEMPIITSANCLWLWLWLLQWLWLWLWLWLRLWLWLWLWLWLCHFPPHSIAYIFKASVLIASSCIRHSARKLLQWIALDLVKQTITSFLYAEACEKHRATRSI